MDLRFLRLRRWLLKQQPDKTAFNRFIKGNTAQLRLRVTANLLHQLGSFQTGKYIQYSSGLETLIWHKIFCCDSLPNCAVLPENQYQGAAEPRIREVWGARLRTVPSRDASPMPMTSRMERQGMSVSARSTVKGMSVLML